MRLNDLSPPRGARRETRRLGRGNASGQGTTAGKGTKGQKARSGGMKAGFRGMSSRNQRYPKAPGFTNIFRKEFFLVKLSDLDRFEANATVDAEALKASGLVKGRLDRRVKLLANGEINKPLVIRFDKVTQSARRKVEAAGGRIEEQTDVASGT